MLRLPDHFDAVLPDFAVARHDRQPFSERLGYQQPVERILVVERKSFHHDHVREFHRQQPEVGRRLAAASSPVRLETRNRRVEMVRHRDCPSVAAERQALASFVGDGAQLGDGAAAARDPEDASVAHLLQQFRESCLGLERADGLRLHGTSLFNWLFRGHRGWPGHPASPEGCWRVGRVSRQWGSRRAGRQPGEHDIRLPPEDADIHLTAVRRHARDEKLLTRQRQHDRAFLRSGVEEDQLIDVVDV